MTENGKHIGNDPFNIAMMDMDGEFFNNYIPLHYFNEFTFKNISS